MQYVRQFLWTLCVSLYALIIVAAGLGLLLLGWAEWAEASPNEVSNLQQPPTAVAIHLGTADNALVFEPSDLQFMAGTRYTLALDNPSPQKHYFTAKDFADAIWTQKVEAGGVEVKGAVHELEIKPGAIAEWTFVPLKSGHYELHCSIAGHTEMGMKGQIAIANP